MSVRTICRDIATLIASGITIEGAAGVDYVLRAPIFLPPLTLTVAEMGALNFALTLATRAGDAEIPSNVARVRRKVAKVVPEALTRAQIENLAVYAPDSPGAGSCRDPIAPAIAHKTALAITYRSLDERISRREIRPLQT